MAQAPRTPPPPPLHMHASICNTPAGCFFRVLYVGRQLVEILRETTRTGPVLLSREEALRRLLPQLDRSEAKAFIELVELTVGSQLIVLLYRSKIVQFFKFLLDFFPPEGKHYDSY